MIWFKWDFLRQLAKTETNGTVDNCFGKRFNFEEERDREKIVTWN